MMPLTPDQWVNLAASATAAAACAVFAVAYHWNAPWWRSDIGRNLQLLAASVGGLCLYTILIILWPDGCAAIVLRGLRTALLLAIAALMVQRTRIVIRAQRADKSR
jgi:hypothetical protein